MEFGENCNLIQGMGLQRAKRPKTMAHLEMSAEDDEEQQLEDEEADSDEELQEILISEWIWDLEYCSFVAHASLLPLHKSKSAFAGFQSSVAGRTTRPFDCPVVVKQESSNLKTEEARSLNEIDEMIDLKRGDVLTVGYPKNNSILLKNYFLNLVPC